MKGECYEEGRESLAMGERTGAAELEGYWCLEGCEVEGCGKNTMGKTEEAMVRGRWTIERLLGLG